MPQDRPRSPKIAALLPVLSLGLGTALMASEQNSAARGQSPAAAAREARVARQLAASPDRAPTIADWSGGLPPVDVRYGADGRPGAAAGLAKLRATAVWEAREAAARQLEASRPELRIDDHVLFATPWFVRSTRVFLTEAAAGFAPADVVARYVHDHRELFEIDALEIPAARVSRDFVTDHNGVTHLTFQQQCRGVDIFGCEVRGNVIPDGRLINIGSTMLPRPGGDFAPAEYRLSAGEAVVAAARAVMISLVQTPRVKEGPEGLSERTVFEAPVELRGDEPVVCEKVYFPISRDELRAAYHVVIPVMGVGHTYEVIVDGGDGSLLARDNRLVWESTQPVSMRVYTSDGVAPMSPSHSAPSAVQAPVVPRELVTINPADVVAYSPNGWINDFDTQTLGNNLSAHLDHDANNTPDTPRPDGGAARVFDFPMDPSSPPLSHSAAAVTQVFYLGNMFHDRLYALGFNEAASNFQAVNFSGQGAGNDRLMVDVQEGLATANPPYDNANFSGSGADGTSARVQMYVFSGSDPDRDSAFSADIVYHEFAHGLSIRLLRGIPFNAMQPRAMGEGWSDYFALSLLAEPGDDPNANYAMSPYLTYQFSSPSYTTNFYFGIRRFPYSTNMIVNPLTFADIDDGQYAVPPSSPINPVVRGQASEEHNAGEMWCNTLMECRAKLWARYGFAGNELMMRLAVDGMKLSPLSPTYVQSRDGILQADMVNHARANRVPLWAGFAKRGLGHGAAAPSNTSMLGVVESFTAPFTAEFDYPDGVPSRLESGRPTSFRVRITADELTFVPGTHRLVYTVNEGAARERALILTGGPNEYMASLPPLSCFDRVRFSIRVGTDFGDYVNPVSGGHEAIVYQGESVLVADDFQSDAGWTVGPDTAVTGRWVRVDPIGSAAQPEDDHSPAPGTVCWVTGQGSVGGAIGEADVDGGATVLTSPTFDLSNAAAATVSYWRWYSNSGSGISYADVFRVEVSNNNGTTWVSAETIGPGGPNDPDTNPGWRPAVWTLAEFGLAPTAQVRVRFIAEDAGAGSAVEAAIDDFRIEALACDSAPPCVGDFNRSGQVTVQDVLDFLTAYFAGAPAADINGADGVSVQDVFDYLAAYFAGCR